MKIFSWMQSKLSGSQRVSKPNTSPPKNYLVHDDICKEEFSDWPNGLLAIGTFGNSNLKDPEKSNDAQETIPPEEITNEELRELHKQLKLLSNTRFEFSQESPKHNLPPEEFFDCLKTLEDDRSASELSKGKDSHLHKKKNISKKSVTYLLRKAFHRSAKPKLAPLLGDPLRELKLEKSRLEKILRAILKKKVYPQSCSAQAPTNKSLDQKQHVSNSDSDDESFEKETSEGSKWVKTDSDFIVLEI